MKNKPLSIVFSLLIAFVLWLYVITVVSPESTDNFLDVPVSLSSESLLTEKSLMLVSKETPTVDLVLGGNRSDLVNINRENLTVVADLGKITEAGTYQLTYTVTPPNNMNVTVQDRQPSTITVEVVEKIKKSVPVRINYSGTVPEGYIMDKENAVLDYTEILVEGPKSVVEQIDHAAIEVQCDGRTESLAESLRYMLCDAEGNPLDVSLVQTEVAEVRVEIRVSCVKKIGLVLTVNDGGGATRDTSSIVIEPEEISVSGSETALANLDELVLGTVNLAEITDQYEKEFDITSLLPEGVKNESGITTAKVTISFPALSTKEFTITNIQTTNVAEGMEAELLTKQLTITVRGPKAQVDALKAEDITAVLDLTGVVNSDTVVPTVTFGENCPDVGVLGKPTVSVTVAEPSEPEE